MHQDNCGYLCMIIQPALKEDAGWYTVSARNDAGIISSTARLDVHGMFQTVNQTVPVIYWRPAATFIVSISSVLSSLATAKPPQAQEGASLHQSLRCTDGERARREGGLLSWFQPTAAWWPGGKWRPVRDAWGPRRPPESCQHIWDTLQKQGWTE